MGAFYYLVMVNSKILDFLFRKRSKNVVYVNIIDYYVIAFRLVVALAVVHILQVDFYYFSVCVTGTSFISAVA